MHKTPFFFAVLTFVLILILICAVCFSTSQGVLVAYLISCNLVSLFMMGLDKSLSKGSSQRVPEVIFFSLASLGGAAAILVGAHLFRHKTKKASFQFVLLLIFAANIFVANQFGLQLRLTDQ